jgi:hypothetical protein
MSPRVLVKVMEMLLSLVRALFGRRADLALETVVRWHRASFKKHWGRGGRRWRRSMLPCESGLPSPSEACNYRCQVQDRQRWEWISAVAIDSQMPNLFDQYTVQRPRSAVHLATSTARSISSPSITTGMYHS